MCFFFNFICFHFFDGSFSFHPKKIGDFNVQMVELVIKFYATLKNKLLQCKHVDEINRKVIITSKVLFENDSTNLWTKEGEQKMGNHLES